MDRTLKRKITIALLHSDWLQHRVTWLRNNT